MKNKKQTGGEQVYNVTEEKVIIENEEYTVYGIKCNEAYVRDVSGNSEEVKRLVERLNEYELSPCHLYDVVEDFIN